MGITPISNLLPPTFASPASSALEPLPMARVENSGRTGDDAYSPSNAKSSRGSEDDTDDSEEEEAEDLQSADSESAPEPRAGQRESLDDSAIHPVSFFA
jgi:hypothetical protein